MAKVRAFLVCCTALGAVLPANVPASSHREAPRITATPKVDGTDLYLFRSYEQGRTNYVTLIANYQPFQDPFGGPNYYMMDPNAVYEIHVDNDGDARADITFQFRFKNTNKDTELKIGDKQVSIPLIQSGPISAVNPPTLNVRETFTARVARRGGGRGGAITNAGGSGASNSSTFDKPVDNIGNKTIVDYAAYAAQHIYNVRIPGCDGQGRMFVGQRKEGFAIAVGEIFDLVNIANPVGPASGEANDLEDKNVTSLALEVPTSCLTDRGSNPIIGAWTTARLSGSGNVLNTASNTRGGGDDDDDDDDRRAGGGGDDDSSSSSSGSRGSGRQVSRLGMPLVNEVVIGLKDKDRFNASQPRGDAQFAEYVTNPTLPALIEKLFSAAGVKAPTKFPRTDLVVAFLTGIPGLNQPKNVRPAEMIRLNTSIPPMAKGSQNALGVLGGDKAGFPNGRRPGDDVVDIELRVAMGVLCTLNMPKVFGCVPADAPSGGLPFTDGVATSDARFDATFPYLRTPMPGAPDDYIPAAAP